VPILLKLALLAIPGLIGMIALGWCYALADILQKKWVKIPEFITSIRFGLMTLFALIFAGSSIDFCPGFGRILDGGGPSFVSGFGLERFCFGRDWEKKSKCLSLEVFVKKNKKQYSE
jgi:hypothetical protein